MPGRRSVLLGLSAWGLIRPASAAETSGAALIAALRAGGLTVYLRHAATVASQIDTGRRGDRTGQRNLSERGRVQAAAIGRAFAALDIPRNEVLSSEIFRSLDTAHLAFGVAATRVVEDLLADDYAASAADTRANAAGIVRRLATPRAPGTNTILVGHRTPLEIATGDRFPDAILAEGAMALFRADATAPAGWRLLGTLSAEALIAAAERR